jgi:hypothetical protein
VGVGVGFGGGVFRTGASLGDLSPGTDRHCCKTSATAHTTTAEAKRRRLLEPPPPPPELELEEEEGGLFGPALFAIRSAITRGNRGKYRERFASKDVRGDERKPFCIFATDEAGALLNFCHR